MRESPTPAAARLLGGLLLAGLAACGGKAEDDLSTRVAREMRGVWVSAQLEQSTSAKGEVSWRRRVFEFGEQDFRLTIDVFGNAAATDRRLTLEFVGPWRLGAASSRVEGAVEAEFGHRAWYLTVRSPALLARVATSACTDAPWALDVRQDVSARGCLGIAAVEDCRSEYDIVAIRDGRLRFGDRVVTPCRPEQRLTTLSPTDAFVRTSDSYEDVLASWNPPR
jgi:hypothetical protein